MALSACSNLGGLGLHQGIVDYSTELYYKTFTPLRSIKPQVTMQQKIRRGLGALLVTYGLAETVRWSAERARDGEGGRRGRKPKVIKAAEQAAEQIAQGAAAAGKKVQGLVDKAGEALEERFGGKGKGPREGEGSGEVWGDVPGGGEGLGERVKRKVGGGVIAVAGTAGKPVAAVVEANLKSKMAKALGAF